MNPTDFGKMSPPEFENFCGAFLRAAGWANVTQLGTKGGDKGRDFTASKFVEVAPDRKIEQKWVIQCKRTRALTTAHLAEEVAKTAQHPFDFYLLLTSAVVTANLRDSLKGLRDRFHVEILVYDASDLAALVDDRYPDVIANLQGTEISHATTTTTAWRLLDRPRAVPVDSQGPIDAILSEYVSRGLIGQIKSQYDRSHEFYVSPEDAVFHSILSGTQARHLRNACGGWLQKEVMHSAHEAATRSISAIKKCSVVSLDWTDTLVDDINLDEFICEQIAIDGLPVERQTEAKFRFHKIIWSICLRSDPKWYDYGYLAGLMGRSKKDVFRYHRSCDRLWGFLPGARELLSHLAKTRKRTGLRFGLVTHCYRDVLECRAKLLQLDLDLFDFVYTGDLVSDLTDKEPLLRQALDDLHLFPGSLVHFGDDVRRDINPATRLGSLAVLVRAVLREHQTFWTSAKPPYSLDLLELKQAGHHNSTCGIVTALAQIQRLLS